jgi:tetratricopeptide (TPR) repeat protein
MMLFLIVVLLLNRHIKPGWLGTLILCFAVAVSTFWTYNRNKVWKDDISLRRDAVAKSPRKARPHYGLGVALAKQGFLDEAIVHFNFALNINPEHTAARNSLGSALARKGRIKEAIEQYHKVLEINPVYKGAYYNLGKVQVRMGHIESAILSFKKALEIDPDMAQVLYNFAWILATTRDGKYRDGREAVRLAKRLLKLSGDKQPLSLDTLAAAYAEVGRFEAAVSTAMKALALSEKYEMVELSAGIRERLTLYQNNRPYRQPAG